MSFAVKEVSYFVPLVPVMVKLRSTSPFHGYLCRAETVMPGSAAKEERARAKNVQTATIQCGALGDRALPGVAMCGAAGVRALPTRTLVSVVRESLWLKNIFIT
jgi:hypothetical protein